MDHKPASSTTIILIIAAIAIVLTLIVWPLSRLGKGNTASNSDDVELRIQPVAQLQIKSAATGAGKARSGEEIYNSLCAGCHGAGIAGAPKTGDKAAWAPRIAQGMPALIKSAAAGKGAMPPKGGGADLSDAEFKSAVEYLTSKAK